MYWPTANARRLTTAPAGIDVGADAVHAAPSRDQMLWALLSPSMLVLWATRPCQVLAAVRRTPHSLELYGANARVAFRADGAGILVQTTRDSVLFYDIVRAADPIYAYVPPARSDRAALAPAASSLHAAFQPGAGEHAWRVGAPPFAGDMGVQLLFRHAVQVDAGVASVAPAEDHVLIATREPAAIQEITWPAAELAGPPSAESTLLSRLPWVRPGSGAVCELVYARAMLMYVWRLVSGAAYVAAHDDAAHDAAPGGVPPAWVGAELWPPGGVAATAAAVNARFSLIALGLADGTVRVFAYQDAGEPPTLSHALDLRSALGAAPGVGPGRVLTLAWTNDGHALAVGWEHCVGVWSTFGRLLFHSVRDDWAESARSVRDRFLFGVQALFWGPGGTELYMVPSAGAAPGAARPAAAQAAAPDGGAQRTAPPVPPDETTPVYALPFVKAAATTQVSPESARTAFLQSDDSVYVYRGHEQRDLSVIAPENDTWRHIRLPGAYLAQNWPLRYAAISNDGQFIAVAGRRGLAHFSCASGRWKTYTNFAQEQSFAVRGGLQWFQHVLIAACDCAGEIQLRVYSRDAELSNAHLLDLHVLPHPVVLTAMFDTSLLVYTAGNVLYHYLIAPTREHIRLRLCGSISFDGIVGEPARVRGMSWMIPPAQQRFGDPAQDLAVASIIFLVDGKLVLLRPRHVRGAEDELAYDLLILNERIEVYWTNLQGRDTLHNSLWGYDGECVRVWLDVLALAHAADAADAAAAADAMDPVSGHLRENLLMPLEVYPLCILLDRAVVIGAEMGMALRRTLDAASFRLRTSTQLFLHHVLRAQLRQRRADEALELCAHYAALPYFAHILELLLHVVLEDEYAAAQRRAGAPPQLPAVVRFLDHYPAALGILVRCARKTDVTRWSTLFRAAGQPSALARRALERGDLHTAAQYLLVVNQLEDAHTSTQVTAGVLQQLDERHEWALLRQLLLFLSGLDEDGARALQTLSAAAARAPASAAADASPLAQLAQWYAAHAPEKDARPNGLANSVADGNDGAGAAGAPPASGGGAPTANGTAGASAPADRAPARPARPTRADSPSAATLHRAARRASASLSPLAAPLVQANGRIVVPGAELQRASTPRM